MIVISVRYLHHKKYALSGIEFMNSFFAFIENIQ